MRMGFVVVVGLSIFAQAVPAFGWSRADSEACASAPNPDAKIVACTKVIDDPSAPDRERSLALFRRGDAYGAKGENLRADFDYREGRGEKFGAAPKTGSGGQPSQDNIAIPPVVSGAPPAYRDALVASYQGKPVNFTAESLLFLGGAAAQLIKCGLPSDMGDKAILFLFVKAAGDRAYTGADHVKRDILEGIGTHLAGAAIYTAGEEFVRSNLDCSGQVAKTLASGLARAVKANETGPDGGRARFITTCTPKFSEEKCECLAKLGRAVYPNIYQMEYDRSMVKRIAEGGPVVALEIVAVCQIIKY